jgi:outer membrane protein assembly factor BamE (lipoprotein component of BamABCDE complex)
MKYAVIPLAAISLFMACAPVISQRGYMPDPSVEGELKAGTDTKTSVQSRLGYASTTATFGNDSWYYISATEKQVAFFTPTILKRNILAIYFDKDNKVTTIRHYGLADGHVISFEKRETPARGRELTFLSRKATPATAAARRSGHFQIQKSPASPPGFFYSENSPWPASEPPIQLRATGRKVGWAGQARPWWKSSISSNAPAPPAAAAPRCW